MRESPAPNSPPPPPPFLFFSLFSLCPLVSSRARLSPVEVSGTRRSITTNYFPGQQLLFEIPPFLPLSSGSSASEGRLCSNGACHECSRVSIRALDFFRGAYSACRNLASRSPQFARHPDDADDAERRTRVLKRINIFHLPLPSRLRSLIPRPPGFYGIFPSIPELALILTGADSSRYTRRLALLVFNEIPRNGGGGGREGGRDDKSPGGEIFNISSRAAEK